MKIVNAVFMVNSVYIKTIIASKGSYTKPTKLILTKEKKKQIENGSLFW